MKKKEKQDKFRCSFE